MEPITLCGTIIVLFGLWVECESIVRSMVKIVSGSRMLSGIKALSAEPSPAFENRYVQYVR